MTKDEEIRINATLSEFMLAHQMLLRRCVDLAAECASLRTQLALQPQPEEPQAAKAVPDLQVVP